MASGVSVMETTPDDFTQIHILWAAVMTFTVLCNAAVMILAPSRIEKGKAKVARSILFAFNCFILFIGILFMTMKMFMSANFTDFKISENFTVVSGGVEYVLPLISEIFFALDRYSIFGAIASASLCFAFAGVVVQIILWTVEKKEARKKTPVVTKLEPQKSSEIEPCKEQPTMPDTTPQKKTVPFASNGDEKGKTDRTRRLGNKIILKSDAASVYSKYIADKNTR